MGLFSVNELEAIQTAISQEAAEAKKHARAIWLGIDAIKLVRHVPDGHIYNLLLSRPIRLSPDQPLTFHVKGAGRIDATVINSTDEGLVVCCAQPLPDDAVILNVEFDPSFIIRRLGEFIEARTEVPCALAERVVRKEFGTPIQCSPNPAPADLNEDQRTAVAQMGVDPIHFLWGPPGTGKTTTLGAAIASWAEQGQSVLIVSTSNAAVDVAMLAVLKRLEDNGPLSRRLHRLGKSDDPKISQLTKTDFATARVVGGTTARMVLDANLAQRQFDVVVVDEASMVSLLYAVAAATFAEGRLVFGGDFMQLPPICQSDGEEAEQWLGTNIYDWFGIDLASNADELPMALLRTQYRMTNRIGDVVSHLSYRGRLIHGREVLGAPVEFINVPVEWRTSFYSVPEKSYYHPVSVPVVHSVVEALARREEQMEFLLLTPFRPQQSLLGALAFDLRERFPMHRFASSTIHRSQGGERRVVILDLTTHSAAKLARFFEDRHSERLLNVGLSRARDHLVLIGNEEMVLALAARNEFWERLLDRWGDIEVYGAEEILDEPQPFESIRGSLLKDKVPGLPGICSYRSGTATLSEWAELLAAVESPRKLMVMPAREPIDGPFIVRHHSECPPLFVGQGRICLPMDGGWIAKESAQVGRVIWRVGFSHLADEEVEPSVADRMFRCPACEIGHLVLRRIQGELRLACTNDMFRCFFNRRLTLKEAITKVRLSGTKCPRQHPMTARTGQRGSYFMGCENWPDCQCEPVSLSVLEGI